MDEITDIAIDSFGNVFVTGITYSDESSFPVLNGPGKHYKGWGDAFVAKINASGAHLDYCGYIGGLYMDSGISISVDSSGCAYVLGVTSSRETDNFPVVNGPDITYNGGQTDSFVAKISPDGLNLEFCGYIGGAEDEGFSGCLIVNNQYIYIAGTTHSDQNSFPILQGPDLTYNGKEDVYIAKLSSSGPFYEFCGFLGGSMDDTLVKGKSLCFDVKGNLCLGGATYSDETTFPVKKGPHLSLSGKCDAFIANISSANSDILYCGYIGGADRDACSAIAVDEASNVYITGTTYSNEATFPVTVGPDLTFNNDGPLSPDAFVAKINANLETEYCGYIGGASGDYGTSIGLDSSNAVFVYGFTLSNETTFPVKRWPDLKFKGGGADNFIAKLRKDGSSLDTCGYFGGDEVEYASTMLIDIYDSIIISGYTMSLPDSLPVQIGPSLVANRWATDGFVTKLQNIGLKCSLYEVSKNKGSVDFQLTGCKKDKNRQYILFGSLNSLNPGTQIGQLYLPFYWDELTSASFFYANTETFFNFQGMLDNEGCSNARLKLPNLRQEFVGMYLYFSYILRNPIDFVSNPVPVKIVW